jgi:hypothetical protein
MVFGVEGQPLCERCSSSIKIDAMLSPGWKYNGKLVDVAECATSCGLCSLVWKAASQWTLRWHHPTWYYSLSLHKSEVITPHSWNLEVDFHGPGTNSRVSSFTVFTNENDCLEELHGLSQIGVVGPSTASALSFATVRNWLRRCLNCHPEIKDQKHHAQPFRRLFCNNVEQTGLGPSRVVDCYADTPDCDTTSDHGAKEFTFSTGADDASSHEAFPSGCKLVNLEETNGQYAALSYCWGRLDYKTYVTTEKNVVSRHNSIEDAELPQVFQDAILVARKLKIRYLWIDALCIVQDWFKPLEDQEDWTRESAKMADIFSGALITIFAAGAIGSEAGLFNEASRTAFDNPDISFTSDHARCTASSARFVHSNGQASTLHFVDEDRGTWRKRRSLKGSCLDRRVWCYQEDLLSPRKLYYCADQLYWHCDHVITSEDRLVDRAKAPRSEHAVPGRSRYADPSAAELNEYWYVSLMSDQYSARETTYERDRLVAVSGLARRVGATIKSRYLAGLWLSTVIQGLNWTANASSSTKTNDAPSWSWASQQGGFFYQFPVVENLTSVCTFLRADIDYLNPRDSFGGVTYGALTLRGRLLAATLKEDGCELPLLQNVFSKATWDDHTFDASVACIMALPLSIDPIYRRIYVLLISKSASDSGKYVRVGSGLIDSSVKDVHHLQIALESLPETDVVLM